MQVSVHVAVDCLLVAIVDHGVVHTAEDALDDVKSKFPIELVG